MPFRQRRRAPYAIAVFHAAATPGVFDAFSADTQPPFCHAPPPLPCRRAGAAIFCYDDVIAADFILFFRLPPLRAILLTLYAMP